MEITTLPKQELPQIRFTEKKQQRFKENQYAPIEPRTQKILEKLKKRLSQIDQKITPEGLDKSREKIHSWINRHTAERVNVNNTDFRIFTEGLNAAKMSRRVENFRRHLQNDFYHPEVSSLNLKGRVSIPA